MRRLNYLDAAKRDFLQIQRYIVSESGSLKTAQSFVRRLQGRCEKLAKSLGTLGRARDELEPGLRSLADKSYVIFFRYDTDEVNIVTILHGMRDIDAHFDGE